jgi:hypothetical protein
LLRCRALLDVASAFPTGPDFSRLVDAWPKLTTSLCRVGLRRGCLQVGVSRLSAPLKVVAAMAHVCRPEGLTAVIDRVASEDPVLCAVHYGLKKVRTPNKIRVYPRSELAGLLESCGLAIAQCSCSRWTSTSGWRRRGLPREWSRRGPRCSTRAFAVEVRQEYNEHSHHGMIR